MNRNITVRETETLARRHTTERRRVQPVYREEAESIEQALGNRVHIEKQGEEGGKIVIDFFSKQDLHDLMEKITKEKDEDDMYSFKNFSL